MTTPKKMKQPITKIVIGVILFLITGVTLYLIWQMFFSETSRQKKTDMVRLQSEEYQAVFLSMFPVQNYAEEDFATFRGLTTVKTAYELPSLKELSAYIDTVFANTSVLNTMYLGLDPRRLHSGKDTAHLLSQVQSYLQPVFQNHPGTAFEILLPYPSVSYWNELSAEDTSALLDTYRALAEALIAYENISVYFMGAEEWLIANPANYEDSLLVNTDVSRSILLHTFCDHHYRVTADTIESTFTKLADFLNNQKLSPSAYTDASNLSVVFFGDSIIGNYTGSLSIPGVVQGLSNTSTYNCGFGGISAAKTQADSISFSQVMDAFLQKNPSLIPDDSQAYAGLKTFLSADTQTQRLCFVINFGLNDYFIGSPIVSKDPYDISTYSGSLRTAVIQLKEEYPEADILLMTPSFSTYFNNGMEKQGENGGVLTDYVNAVLSLSDELSVDCMNLYDELGINAENHLDYLADGCHFNEMGRYLVGGRIVKKLQALMTQD